MVTIKKIIIFLTFLNLLSCSDYYLVSSETKKGGLRSFRKYRRYINNRINPEDIKISTDVLYTPTHFYKNGIYHKKVNIKEIRYLHFYKNGTYYRFFKDPNAILDSTSFDPKFGDIGFVIKRGNKYLTAFYIIIDAGQFKTAEIKMEGNTLVNYFKNGEDEFLTYYKKIQIPKKWLDFKPDF